MKLRDVLFLFLFCPYASYGQQNLLPDYFVTFEGVTIITTDVSIIKGFRDCPTCKPPTSNIKFREYHFDKSGRATTRYSFYKDEASGKQSYYYKGNSLSSYENRSTHVSTGNGMEMVWDSTKLTQTVVYEYDSTYGVLLTNLKWFDGNEKRLKFEINYKYDKTGNLLEEEIINYPDLSSLGRFEPNTSKWIPDPDAKRFYTNRKERELTDNGVIIRWFKEDSLTAIETWEEHPNTDFYSILKDTNGNVLWEITKKYTKERRPLEIVKKETGYDGFGDPYDFPPYDRVTFHYNDYGHLVMKRYFQGNTLESEEHFEYIK